MSSNFSEKGTSFRPASLNDPLVAGWLAGGEARFNAILRRADRRGKAWAGRMNYQDVVAALRRIVAGEHPAMRAVVLCDTHLFVYCVGPVWWDDHTNWLIEQFFVRIGPGDTDPLAAIEELAVALCCKHVVFGTSLAPDDEALGRYLATAGYTKESSQYIKEVTWQH